MPTTPLRPSPSPVGSHARPRVAHSVLWLPLAVLLAATSVAWIAGGSAAAAALVSLAAYEVALNADSAVPMAGVAGRLHTRTKQIFLAVGLLAGVLVMRLLAPPLVVSGTASEPVLDTATDVVVDPAHYAQELADIRPGLAGFGGVFLWMVFSEYLFNCERKDRPLWITPLERPFAKLSHPRLVQFAVGAVFAVAAGVSSTPGQRGTVLAAGAAGWCAYGVVKLVALRTAPPAQGWWRAGAHGAVVVFERALAVFMLLEVLDGAYSFTGGVGGLPTWERWIIAVAGVGIGAIFLVQLTRRLDARQSLQRYVYLPAGAAYVLGVLAVLLWTSLVTDIPSAVAGWFGGIVVAAALTSSLVHNRRVARRSTVAV